MPGDRHRQTASRGPGRARRVGLGSAALVGVALGLSGAEPAVGGAGKGAGPAVASAAAGGPRRWQPAEPGGLALRAAPRADAAVIETLDADALLDNLGCEPVGDALWCRVRPPGSRTGGHAPAALLRPARGPDGRVPTGPDDSPLRAARGDYDATAEIRCAQDRGQPMGACAARVARSGGGDATVVAAFPNGFARRLFFTGGRFVRADATMSGSGRDTDWRIEGGLFLIRVDDQRYALPRALVLGP